MPHLLQRVRTVGRHHCVVTGRLDEEMNEALGVVIDNRDESLCAAVWFASPEWRAVLAIMRLAHLFDTCLSRESSGRG